MFLKVHIYVNMYILIVFHLDVLDFICFFRAKVFRKYVYSYKLVYTTDRYGRDGWNG